MNGIGVTVTVTESKMSPEYIFRDVFFESLEESEHELLADGSNPGTRLD